MKNERQNIFDLKYGNLRGQKEDGTIVDFLNTESPSDLKIYSITFSAADYISAASQGVGLIVFDFPNNGKYIQIDNAILQKINSVGYIAPSTFQGSINIFHSSDGSTPEESLLGFSSDYNVMDIITQITGINSFIFNSGYYVLAPWSGGQIEFIPQGNWAYLGFLNAPVDTEFKNGELISSSNGGTASIWFQEGEAGTMYGIYIYDMIDNNGDPTNGQFFVGSDIVGEISGGTASIDTATDYNEGEGDFKLIISYREYEV